MAVAAVGVGTTMVEADGVVLATLEGLGDQATGGLLTGGPRARTEQPSCAAVHF